MITVITPATDTKLTTIERARALLGFGVGDDATVRILIEHASSAIVDHCRRPFATETVRETFEGPSASGAVLLGRSAVTSFDEVRRGSEIIEPRFVQYDPATGLLFRIDDDGWRVGWGDRVSVTYAAGYVLPTDNADAPPSTLPPAVERAAIKLVAAYLSIRGRDALIKSETTEGVGATSFWVPSAGAGLADPEAAGLLADYRRIF
ncbi:MULTISPECIES: hypothetical protein [unclassified Aureimonas]|uniref:hypothetical protein n=1 Tax=unclassified Aureimonas TaxID=2615206 RepID=UPI00070DF9FC|nr:MULTISPECIES: hypothetical protein [unclassified Aureimonas]KQT57477.1 hypothetical protein ASG62_09160 [Aureimonas sp. Leaf427]